MRRPSDGGAWWASPGFAGACALAPTVLGAFLIVHELSLHWVLNGVTFSQDGSNFATSLVLTKAQLPYSLPSLATTQPPGLAILLLPFAWAGHGFSAGAVSSARIFTAAVAVIDVFLVGFSARRHGVAAVVLAGTLFALFPYSFRVTASVMLEPYLVFFCLCGLLIAFEHGELSSGWRLALGGFLLGYAVAIKPWAIVPAGVLLVCACVHWRDALARIASGLAVGIVLPCIIFFLAAPRAFFHDVVASEVSGLGHAGTQSVGARIAELLGLGPIIGLDHPVGVAEGVLVVLVLVVAGSSLARLDFLTTLDWLQLSVAGALFAIGMIPASLPVGYTYLAAAFGLIVVGGAAGNILSLVSGAHGAGGSDFTYSLASGLTVVLVAAMITVLTLIVPKESRFEGGFFLRIGTNPARSIDRIVVKGSCVISNDPGDLIIAERFVQLPPGCPAIIDPAAVASTAATRSAAAAEWQQWMSEAHFVVLSTDAPAVAWTPALRAYFAHTFSLALAGRVSIYVSRNAALP